MRLNLRSPATQKWVIFAGLLFGILYGYSHLIYAPRKEKIVRLTDEIQRESELLAKGKRVAVNYRSVQDDYVRLTESWELALELLPTQKEMEDLLKSITLEGQHRDVSFLLFRPLDPIEKPYYWENPIQVKTLSTYHDLADFLSAVASLERIVNINGLKLTSFQPNRGRSPYTVEAEFTASIYIFKDLGTPATVEPAAQNGKAKRPGNTRTKQLGDAPEAARVKQAANAGGPHT